MPKDEERNVFTIPQTARFCAVGRITVWRWVQSGKLKAWRTDGGHHRIHRDDIEAFLARKGMLTSRLPSRNPRILIVDDDATIRVVLSKSLSDHGYTTEMAADGFEAGIKVMRFRPDIILLDLIMPGMDGFMVCRQVKSSDATDWIKIVVLTGYGTPENREQAINAGADGFLVKPVNEETLLSVIRSTLKKTGNIPVKYGSRTGEELKR
jgi:excisionase family DNA binding protein